MKLRLFDLEYQGIPDLSFVSFLQWINKIARLSTTVKGLPTSCACNKASIDKKDLKPREAGVITVEFDPNLHAEPGDKFLRTIYLTTEPKLKEEVELKIWVEIDSDLGLQAYKLKSHKH